ncbi:MAG: NAD(P)H-dependent oxidoreductase subunit E [Anaerolineae bacterium]|nr:NAD(P)H-dependent oxidoreductase subunit E [Anaerolineae bacterium]
MNNGAPNSVALPESIDLALLEPVLAEYAGQRGALIPILQRAQEIYNYLPREVLELIARRLGLSVGKVYGVATFYAQFYLEKRGKHILKLCDGTACHVKGTPVLMTAVEDRYHILPGETSEDGELTVEIVYCLGSCALAPVAVFDGEVMARMRQEMLLRTLKNQLAKA